MARWHVVAAALIVLGARPAPAAPDAVAVRGTVRDAAGRPIPDVVVRCGGFAVTGEMASLEVATDPEGRYEVRGFGRGSTRLTLPSEEAVGDAGVREFAWSEPVTVDFVVLGELDLLGTVAPAPATGGPFTVVLERRLDAGAGAWGAQSARRFALGADGTFRCTALRAGRYTVRVMADDEVRGAATVDLFDAVTRVAVALAPPRHASLRLTAVAAWPDETPSWASAWLLAEGADVGSTVPGTRRDDGRFDFVGLAPGRHALQVRHVFGSEPEASESRERWFTVDVGPAATEASVVCVPSTPVELSLALPQGRDTLVGRVVVRHGPFSAETAFEARREADGSVAIWEPPAAYPGMPPGLRRAPAPGPSLALRDVVRGVAVVRVEALGCAPDERTVSIEGPTSVAVRVAALPGQEVAIAAEGGGSRVAHVRIDARRDEPGAAWTEILWWRAWPRASHGPIPGTLRTFLAPGRYLLRATCDREGDATLAPIDVAANGPAIVLSPRWSRGVAVSGHVRLRGVPVDEGWIYPFRREPDGAWRALAAKEVFVAAGASYRVEGLVAGRYRFAATSVGRPVLGETDVASGDATLELTFPSPPRPAPR